MALLTSMALLTNYDYTHHGPTYYGPTTLTAWPYSLTMTILSMALLTSMAPHSSLKSWPYYSTTYYGRYASCSRPTPSGLSPSTSRWACSLQPYVIQPAAIRNPACNHT